MKFKAFFVILTGVMALSFSSVWAGDINWSGRYLLKGQYIKNPRLTSNKNEYSFLSHHLILNPEFIAGDGIVVHSRFDIFNSESYPNSAVGEFFGGSESATTSTSKQKHATGQVASGTLEINELYLTYANPFGYFIGGRAPVHFGMGLTFNAGKGEFDNWFDTRDLIGYKMVFGNLYFFPTYAKIREGDAEQDEDIQEWTAQAGYDNPDTDLEIGLLYSKRKANTGGVDAIATTPIYNKPADPGRAKSIYTFNVFVKKRTGPVLVKIETSMQSGATGLVTTGGEGISLDGTATIGEIQYDSKGSVDFDLKLGWVSGDNPGTPKYEGYLVNRNWDVALIMFNYLLGPTATSNILGNENYIRETTAGHKADVGFISNSLFLAPGLNWKWSERSGLKGRLIWAKMNQEQYPGQSKDLGFELDASVYYKPYDRITLQLDTGYFKAGKAYQGDPVNPSQNKSAYAIMTKAAISF